ncbi:MAG: hypothetical protein RIC16_10330 [Rhodospirillales bacterium]
MLNDNVPVHEVSPPPPPIQARPSVLVKAMTIEIARLRPVFERLTADPGWNALRFGLAHLLRGISRQARSAGYELLADYADDACRQLGPDFDLTPLRLAIIARYVTAIEFLIDYRIDGRGSAAAREHLRTLRECLEANAA